MSGPSADVVSKKFERRVIVVERMIQLRMATNEEEDLGAWKWLKSLLDFLGADGMSSDESSSTDRLETVFRVKIMVWRRKMEDCMDIIDQQRIVDPEIYAAQGTKPVKRIRGPENPNSHRLPVTGLPRSLYNEGWLASKSEHYRQLTLHVSKEQFRWINIVAEE